MDIGPLEYVVIGLKDDRLTDDMLLEFKAIQEHGLVRVVDLLFVRKTADGVVTIQEVNELSADEQQAYSGLAEELMGLLTTQDVEHLAKELPPGMVAVIVLLEHTWTLELAAAVRRANGVLFTGGMIAPETLAQLSIELTTAKEEHDA
jgi:hypothetical protein